LQQCAPVIDGDIDWPRALRISRTHGVTPLLAKLVKASHCKSIPETFKDELDRYVKANARRNTILAFEAVRILSELNRNNIRAATFKGAVLAQAVYGDLSLREFLDIDIIVPPADVSRCEEVLRSLGYETNGHDPGSDEYYRASGQCPFQNSATGVKVDLHWKFAPFGSVFPFETAEIREQLQTVTIAGQSVPTLSWEHLAMFLAFHGTKERWRLLKWVCDFSQLVRTAPGLDWLAIHNKAKQRHCSRQILLAVLLASDLLEVEADPTLLQMARADSTVRALAEESKRKMLLSVPEGDFEVFVYALKSMDRFRDRVALVRTLSTTLTVSDHNAAPLPRQFHLLLYLVRPTRLAWKLLRLAMRAKFSLKRRPPPA